jgi:hypothetical protein
VFELPSIKDKKKLASSRFQADSTSSSSLANVVHLSQTNGEYEKLINGVHENFLKCKITDVGGANYVMKPKTIQAFDWFQFYDLLEQQINSKQLHEFLAYMPYSIGKFHSLFAAPILKFKIEYPRSSYQVSIFTCTLTQVLIYS